MTLTTIILIIALAAIVLTLLTRFFANKVENLAISYLQNFCGAWFVFSGYVKVADPLGTAYKMEQYFDEFSATASGAGMSFLEPIFSWSSDMSVYISMFMVVLEVVLGVMLILGIKPKFTAWTFALIMIFFTVLTGFTYLTGYVPTGSNFFAFSEWGPYVKTNMRVTDCGCFGDFIKLEPYTSFLKDCFLMIPAIAFLIYHSKMHQFFSEGVRSSLGWATVVLSSLFGMSNFIWGLPIHDFRPFAEGINIREKKKAEQEAAEAIEILAYGITNKATGEYQEIPFNDYMKRYKEFPTEQFDLEQITSEPTVAHTKVSEFELEDQDGAPVAEDILNYEGYSIMVVAYKLYDEGSEQKQVTKIDSMFVQDTTATGEPIRVFAATQEFTEMANVTKWKQSYAEAWREHIVPLADAAEAAGWKVFAATSYTDPERVSDFQHTVQFAHPIYEGDDIMLKTIIRSNPGVVVMKDGEVIRKYHVRHTPSFKELEAELN